MTPKSSFGFSLIFLKDWTSAGRAMKMAETLKPVISCVFILAKQNAEQDIPGCHIAWHKLS